MMKLLFCLFFIFSSQLVSANETFDGSSSTISFINEIGSVHDDNVSIVLNTSTPGFGLSLTFPSYLQFSPWQETSVEISIMAFADQPRERPRPLCLFLSSSIHSLRLFARCTESRLQLSLSSTYGTSGIRYIVLGGNTMIYPANSVLGTSSSIPVDATSLLSNGHNMGAVTETGDRSLFPSLSLVPCN